MCWCQHCRAGPPLSTPCVLAQLSTDLPRGPLPPGAVPRCCSMDGEDYTARVLSTQHCGLNPEEAARIEAGFASGAR